MRKLGVLAGAVALTFLLGNLPYLGVDAHVYWATGHTRDLYGQGATVWSATYLYSPLFAQLIRPLTVLPWPAFFAVWTTVGATAYWWLLAPLSMPLRISVFVVLGAAALPLGNIEWLLALAVVVALRYPAAWAVALLTKVTPGVGVLWHLARGDWTRARWAAGLTALLVLGSWLAVPSLWAAWLELLAGQHGPDLILGTWPGPGLLPRVGLAALLVLWGARRGMPAVLPLAMLLAQPDIAVSTLGLLAAVPRLGQRTSERRIELRQLVGRQGDVEHGQVVIGGRP